MSASDETPKSVTEPNQEQNDEWIVQSKPRRLVPQHSLSRQDLEADKAKSAAAPELVKKKGRIYCYVGFCCIVIVYYCIPLVFMFVYLWV
jgi:hypothetical protein